MEHVKRRRVSFIDELRGLCILLMVVYHAAYDIVYIFGHDITIFHWNIVRIAQPLIAGIFILISGISCRYSRNNAKRGAKALALGLLVTAVTLAFMSEQAVYFGILHFMGTAMLLFALLESALDKLHPFWGIIFSAVIFAFTYNLPDGYLGFKSLYKIALPMFLYEWPYLLPLGFGGAGSDYFPIIPWLFLYFAGAYLGTFFANGDFPGWFYREHSRPLAKLGKHTIVIYLMHQPVIMLILWLFFWVINILRPV